MVARNNELSCGTVLVIWGVAILIGTFIWQMPDAKGKSGEWASWVQAFGSVGAIMGAVWIANRETRLAREERQKHEYAASREVAHLAYDVTQFLIRSASADQSKRERRYFVNETEHQELTGRITWARRNVAEKPDIDDLATIRNSLTEVVQHLKENESWQRTIPEHELESRKAWMREVADISNRRMEQRYQAFNEKGTELTE